MCHILTQAAKTVHAEFHHCLVFKLESLPELETYRYPSSERESDDLAALNLTRELSSLAHRSAVCVVMEHVLRLVVWQLAVAPRMMVCVVRDVVGFGNTLENGMGEAPEEAEEPEAVAAVIGAVAVVVVIAGGSQCVPLLAVRHSGAACAKASSEGTACVWHAATYCAAGGMVCMCRCVTAGAPCQSV